MAGERRLRHAVALLAAAGLVVGAAPASVAGAGEPVTPPPPAKHEAPAPGGQPSGPDTAPATPDKPPVGRSLVGTGPRGALSSPEPVTVHQPDGTPVVMTREGDGARSWHVTAEGDTVVLEPDGWWHFADRLDAQGQPVAGTRRAGVDTPPADARGLRPTADRPTADRPTAPAPGTTPGAGPAPAPAPPAPGEAPAPTADQTAGWATELPGPQAELQHKGTEPTLVILAQFADVTGQTTPASWASRYFGVSNSVASFFSQASYGQLAITPAADSAGANDGVVGWVTLPFAHPDLSDLKTTSSAPTIAAAISAANPYVNFASYDKDLDGWIETNELHVSVILAGPEASVLGSAACGNGVWGHQWVLGQSTPTVDGVKVGGWGFTTFGERHCNNSYNIQATLGLIAHEMGHDLQMPDLYDIDRSSVGGVGRWSLMGHGTWNTTSGNPQGTYPALPDAFMRSLQGWVTPSQVNAANGVTVARADTTADVKRLLANPNGVDWSFEGSSGTGEYFLVENRQLAGYDVGLPGCGLLVWHIDESVSASAPNADDTRRLVRLVQADGLNQLDVAEAQGNRGDTGDPFPGAAARTSLGANTTPNSRLYSGADSGVTLSGIGGCASTMTLNVGSPGGSGPANDAFAAATPLGATATTSSSTVGATRETDEPAHGANQGGSSVWWKVTAPGNGSLTVTTTGSSFDTLLGVYTGATVGTLTARAQNDDTAGTTSAVQLNVTSGTTYYIGVDGYRGTNGITATGTVNLSTTFSVSPLTPPTNDAWASAANLAVTSGTPATATGPTFGATAQVGEPAHAGFGPAASVWWKITPPSNGTLALDTRASGFDTLLAVYTGAAVNALSPVPNGANDDEQTTAPRIYTSSVPSFPVTGGTTYYVAVDGYAGVQGAARLRASFTAAAGVTVPSAPASATASYAAGQVTVSWEPATADGGSPITSYQVTASPGGATASYDVAGGGALEVTFAALAPGTYTFEVRAVNGVGPGAAATTNQVVVPATGSSNDAFAGAATVPASGGTVTGSNTAATKEAGERVHAANGGGASVWWKITPVANGSLTVDTDGSSFDTLLAVYTGTAVNSTNNIAENDDDPIIALQSKVRFDVTAGTTYFIAVDGYRPQEGAADTGAVTLHVTHSPTAVSPPANDAFAAAAVLGVTPGATATVSGPSFGATKQAGEPNHAGEPGGASVWWKVVPPTSGTLALDTATSGFDSLIAVYTGSAVGALVPVANASNDDENRSADLLTSRVPAFPVSAGTTYYIAVDGFGGVFGQVKLRAAFESSAGGAGAGFHPVTPFRALDSRTGTGFAGAVGAGNGGVRELTVAPNGAVPANATAVVMNVTATLGTAPSYLTVYPSGGPPPMASNLLFAAGQTVPNLVTVGVGTGGRVSFFNQQGSVHVIADVVGWYDDGSDAAAPLFNGITPVRALDSRVDGTGWWGQTLGPNEARNVTVVDLGGIPYGAEAVVMNVTATGGTAPSYLQVYPTGTSPGATANVLFAAGQTVPNLVTVGVGLAGDVTVYNQQGSVHVIVDIVGYYDDAGGSRFHPMPPTRILDSRQAVGLSGPWGTNQGRSLAVAGVGPVPGDATGLVANITATLGTAPSYLAASPTPGAVPAGTANLLFAAGQTVPNLVVVPTGAGGAIDLYNQLGTVHVIADASGYFSPT